MKATTLFGDRKQSSNGRGSETTLFRESFLSLYSNLGFSRQRSLIVTSANPQEGKSTVAVNLALAIARGEGPVLLVDADMRQPILPRIFGRTDCPGLTDLLQGGFDGGTNGELFPQVAPGLHLLSNGVLRSDNPAGLFRSADFGRLFETLRHKYTTVIWDSSPVLTAAEVVALASVAEQVLLVVGAGRVTRDEAQRAKACLERAGCHIVGTVLNSIDLRNGSATHAHGNGAAGAQKW